MKKCFLSLMLLLTMGVSAEISMTNISSQEMENVMYTIGKIVIQDDYIYLVSRDGEILGSDRMSNVRSIVFVDKVSSVNNIESMLSVYPNPTQDIIHIRGIEDATLRVFDLNGRCLITTKGQQVDVQSLINGVYLLQVNTQIH